MAEVTQAEETPAANCFELWQISLQFFSPEPNGMKVFSS
jgi:hypothetical protein